MKSYPQTTYSVCDKKKYFHCYTRVDPISPKITNFNYFQNDLIFYACSVKINNAVFFSLLRKFCRSLEICG